MRRGLSLRGHGLARRTRRGSPVSPPRRRHQERAPLGARRGGQAGRRREHERRRRGERRSEVIGTWPYYRSKLFAEQKAFELRQPGFEVVAINPTLLLGPGDLRGSSTKDVEDILEGRILAIPEGGMSFVDARDAAVGMILAWERGKDGERYLLSAQNLTVRAFAEKIARIAGVSLPAMRMPRSRVLATLTADLFGRMRRHTDVVPKLERITLEMAQYFWYVDASRAQRDLGWSHRDPMTTLADTVDDLTRRGVVWPRSAPVDHA
jgi:dihydroflavonol-4-reductase